MQTVRVVNPWLTLLSYVGMGAGLVLLGYTFLILNQPASYANFMQTSIPVEQVQAPLSIEIPDYQDYENFFKNRDLFSAVASSPMTTGEGITPSGQLPSNIKVVGLMFGNTMQVVLEDTQANKTYFVSEHKPDGGIAIVSVKKDAVIISYQGQNISINLHDNAAVHIDKTF